MIDNCVCRLSDPVGILTRDLQNRNLTFYTAELRSLFVAAKVVNYSNSEKNTRTH